MKTLRESRYLRLLTGAAALLLTAAVLIAVNVGAAPAASASSEELDVPLANGDFEDVTGETVPSWTTLAGADGQIDVVDDLAYSGERSLRFVDDAATATSRATSARLPIEDGYSYTVTAFVHRSGTNPLANIYSQFFDESGALITSTVSGVTGAVDDWVRVAHVFEPPENAVSFAVMLYTGLNSIGVTHFDNVTVTATRPLTEAVVLNPGFEEPLVDGQIPQWSQTFGDSGAISRTDEISHGGEYSAHIRDRSETVAQGIQSNRFPVLEGEQYRATAYVHRVEGAPLIYLRFYDESGALLTSTASPVNTPIKTWGVATHDAPAPASATHASVLLYSAGPTLSESYWDDVSIALSPVAATNLGPQHHTVNAAYSVVAQNRAGEMVGYLGVYGSPASLIEVDLETGEVLRSTSLPGAGGVWGIDVSDDGLVYAGTLSNGALYRWDPDAGDAELLGKPVAGEAYVNALTVAPDGMVYGGTFPNGHVFSYDPAAHAAADFSTAVEDFGQVVPDATYTRSIHWHLGKVYAGAGTPAQLVELDPATGILRVLEAPAHVPAGEMVYGIESAGDLVSVRYEFPGNLMLFDPATEEWSPLGESAGLMASPLSEAGEIYFRGAEGGLVAFDVHSKTLRQTGFTSIPNMRRSGWVQLEDPKFPGETLVWFDSTGNLYRYNPESGASDVVPAQAPGVPVAIHSIGVGGDGRVYTSAYVSGGLVSYDPASGERVDHDTGIGQADSYYTDGSRLWIGAYTKAQLWEFDTTPDEEGEGSAVLHFTLAEQRQDRPMALTKLGDTVVMGTVAEYGRNGGALTVYEPEGDTAEPKVYPDVVDNHSVVALATDPGSSSRIVYGGTSVDGGLGSTPKASQGKVFAFDVDRGEVLWETDGAPGERAVPGLVMTPSGTLWGVGTGTIFEIDPADGTVLRTQRLVDSGTADVVWTGSAIDLGPDGNLYVWAGRQIMRVDPKTMEVTPLTAGAIAFAADFSGETIYFGRGTDLYSLDISDVLGEHEVSGDSSLSQLLANGSPIAGFDPGRLEYSTLVDLHDPVPTITARASDDQARIRIERAPGVPGETIVVVVAGDGSEQRYTVAFTHDPDSEILNVRPPAISGTASVGSTLSADVGTWSYADLDYSITWLRDGVPIEGATGDRYEVTSADVGTELSIRVIAVAKGTDFAAETLSAPAMVEVGDDGSADDGSTGGGSDDDGSAGAGDDLAMTGADSRVFLGVAGLLFVAGAVLLVIRRRNAAANRSDRSAGRSQ